MHRLATHHTHGSGALSFSSSTKEWPQEIRLLGSKCPLGAGVCISASPGFVCCRNPVTHFYSDNEISLC